MEKKYRKRVLDAALKEYLEASGAVLIEGPKWCGKTTSAMQFAKSVLMMHNPDKLEQNLFLAERSVGKLLTGETPRLIDEWQIAPKIWDAVRYEVDVRAMPGQFILTGSAVPADFSKISHSGIGRIARLKMRTMSLWESGDSTGTVSLRALFEGETDIFAENSLDLDKLAFLICRGGWPMALNFGEKAALRQAKIYFDTLVESDISRVDGVRRSADNVRHFLRSYARAIGSQMKNTAIIADMLVNEPEKLAENTVISYLESLRKIFSIEEAPAWNPNLRSKTAIRSSNTRYFSDPSIGIAALRIGPKNLLADLETMGLFFENLVVRDLRVFADALDGNIYHYRDSNNLECDAVIQLNDGKYALVEIKLGGEKAIESAAKTLNKLESIINTEKMSRPSFKLVIVGVGAYAYRRDDGIFVVPVGCLKD